MVTRFSLAVLFAVLAAVARPLATGGKHDLLAVGVRVEEARAGGTVRRVVLAAPTERALAAFQALLDGPAKAALLQGTTVYAPVPPGEGPRVVELVYYGVRGRPGRSPVRFEDAPAATVPGSLEALEAARDLASLPSSVTAAAALDLLRSPDDGAFRDALEALASVQADAAAGVARRTALPAPGERIPSAARRVIAVKTLRALGGAAVFPGEFRKLAGDPDPLVAEAAK